MDMYTNEGLIAIFKGLGAKASYNCMYCLFFLPVYDYVKGEYW
jgi:hypothetical protein